MPKYARGIGITCSLCFWPLAHFLTSASHSDHLKFSLIFELASPTHVQVSEVCRMASLSSPFRILAFEDPFQGIFSQLHATSLIFRHQPHIVTTVSNLASYSELLDPASYAQVSL